MNSRSDLTLRADGLLLDLDGTLVDSTAVVDRQWGLVADRLGLARSDVVGRFHGMTAETTMRVIAPDLADEEICELVAELHAAEVDEADLVTALPGALTLLDTLPADRWAVVTSGPRVLAEARLKGAGLPAPARLVTADEVASGKPDPEPYLLGAAALGLTPARCVAVEDAPSGVHSARAAGCQLLGLRTTHAELEVPTVPDLTWVSVVVEGNELVVTTRRPSGP